MEVLQTSALPLGDGADRMRGFRTGEHRIVPPRHRASKEPRPPDSTPHRRRAVVQWPRHPPSNVTPAAILASLATTKEFHLAKRTPLGAAALGVLSLALCLVTGAAAQTAEGTLTVNGQVMKLTFAYAVAQPGFADNTKEDILVILSETALPDAAVLDSGERRRAIMMGNLKVVRVVLSADRQAISTVIDAPALPTSISFAGEPQQLELKTLRRADDATDLDSHT